MSTRFNTNWIKATAAALLSLGLIAGGSLTTLAQNENATPTPTPTPIPTPTPTPSPTPKTRNKTIDFPCVQTAIQKRDNAIIAAVDTYHTAVVQALTTRRDALVAAWGNTDKTARRAAIKAAWKVYRTSQTQALKALRNGKKEAWKQFGTDRKACGSSAAGDDPTNSGVDAQL